MKTLFAILTCLLVCVGCSAPEKKVSAISTQASTTAQKPSIAVSLPPYTYFVQRIAGDTVTLAPIVPAQSNPHLFEATPKQVKAIQDARLWIRSHEFFEEKILTLLNEKNPPLAIVDLAAHIPDEEEDRHIWLSPKLAQDQAQAITEALIQLLPENKTLYQTNLHSFIEDLQKLDAEIATQLAPFKDEAILTSHPAFEFFCQDYGLVQLSIECEGKDPLPQDLERTLALAKTRKIARILTQPQYNNRGAEIIADHLQVPVSSIDPYSCDYLENLRLITKLIANDTRSQ